MNKYYIWTIGCQMNVAEANYIGNYLQNIGYEPTSQIKAADLIIANTCVVRQSAEDKVIGLLQYLKGIKTLKPKIKIIVTGCFVDSNKELLSNKYPYIDFFFQPGHFDEFYDIVNNHFQLGQSEEMHKNIEYNKSCCAYITIIRGCNNYCSYCIVPYRRGPEQSRTYEDIEQEVALLIENNIKEITLLGQNVNSYGKDLGYNEGLSELLSRLNKFNGLYRIRFLTNHPKDMSDKLIETIAFSEKVCKCINLPIQSGSDSILKAMRRGYTVKQYLSLINRLRKKIPQVAISTDVIVGFPNESEEQFLETLNIISTVKFNKVHVAMYSPRPGTLAYHKYRDNISNEEKKRRLIEIEKVQTDILRSINENLLGMNVPVLVESKKKTRWYGRTEQNTPVFFDSSDELLGKIVEIKINKASPWSLQGEFIKIIGVK